MRRSIAFRLQDERADALIIVILLGLVMSVIAVSMFGRSASTENHVLENSRSARALHVAESGVDHVLFKFNQDRTYTTGQAAPSSFESESAEREWVLSEAASQPVVPSFRGEWAAIKPSNADLIYSVGYIPSRAQPTEVRVLRVTFEVGKFASDVAILAGGDLYISGNPTIGGTHGSAHANGDVTVSGNPEVTGFIASSGEYTVTGSPTVGDTENTGGGKPLRSIPQIRPRDNYDTSEYDLCQDATVRTGPSYTSGPEAPNASGTPCQGSVLAEDADDEAFRGWKLSGMTWTYGGNTAYDGVYYIYQGHAEMSGNPGDSDAPMNATILVEAIEGLDHCPHTGGDLIINGNPRLHPHSKGQQLIAVAGRDLKVSGNYNEGDVANYDAGVLAAHEQMEFSGNPLIEGTAIIEDVCDTTDSPIHKTRISGDPTIVYNGGLELESQTLRVTLWTEL